MREALRIGWILIRYKWLQNVAVMRLGFKKKATTARQATAPKSQAGSFGFAIIYIMILLSLGSSHRQTIKSLIDGSALKTLTQSLTIPPSLLVASPVWDRLPEIYWLGIGLSLLGIAFGMLLIPLSRIGHATQDNELEWISTFPVSPSSFFFGRILQTAVVNALAGFYFIPFSLVFVMLRGGLLNSDVLTVLLFTLVVSLCASSLGQVLDAWVQTRLSPARQRDVRALVIVLSMISLAQFYVIQTQMVWFWRLILPYLETLRQSALFFVLNRTFTSDPPTMIGWVVGAAGIIWLSTFVQTRIYRQGVVEHSGFERQKPRLKSGTWPLLESWIGRIPVMMRRELQLLGRDRTHLTQVLLAPLMFIGLSLANGDDSPVILYFLSMVPMLIILSASMALMQKERTSLWQYAIVPRRLIDVLGDRQKFWAVFAFLYFLAASAFVMPSFSSIEVWLRWLLIPVALLIFQNLSLSIVMLMHEPFAQNSVQRPPVRMTYLLLAVGSVLILTTTLGQPWSILVTFTLMLGVTLACRQSLRDYEPYILDPNLSPPAEASLGGGLIAALVYSVLQAAILSGITSFSVHPDTALLWASLIGGVLTFALMQWHYARRKATGVPVYGLRIKGTEILLILVLTGALVGFAACWLHYAPHWEFWTILYQLPVVEASQPSRGLSLAVFAGLVAPLIEEYIFRGLIFGGMRRRFGLLPSLLLSSLIFALAHQPLSFAPVFLLGIAAAVLYERTQRLLPGVWLHILYNASILALSRL